MERRMSFTQQIISGVVQELLYRAIALNEEQWFSLEKTDLWTRMSLRPDPETINELLFAACLRSEPNHRIVKFLLRQGADPIEVSYATLVTQNVKTLDYALRRLKRDSRHSRG